MKKKFDFTAEMKEVQVTKSTPQNEYLEEEKRLLGINVKELAELNDNVYGLRTDLTALVDLLGKYRIRKIRLLNLVIPFLASSLTKLRSSAQRQSRGLFKWITAFIYHIRHFIF